MSLLFIRSTFSDVNAILQIKQTLNHTNCSGRSIDEYPDWFTEKQPRYDFVLMHSFAVAYLFWAIAIVCDEYCVPAVEKLSYKLQLSYDVAGATLLAVASSSPEFFINFYATFLTEGDMGVGTIVGSAVFNTLAITACCCLLTGVNFSIDWWPISRDLLWYAVCVVVLTLCLWDNYVMWWEALILVTLYVFNVASLLLDKKLQAKVRDKSRPCKLICFVPMGEVQDFAEMLDPETDAQPFNFLRWPQSSLWHKFFWLLSYPLECLFALTIPSLHRNCSRNCSLLCLVMSIVWISLLTYLCSWSITVISFYLAIPDSVMGLVIMAFGTSIPEAISSIIVTKKGYGSMAICNAIGSNTVDILVCLAAPWLVKATWFPAIPSKNAVFIISDGLVYTSGCLLISAILLYSAFMASRFQIGLMVGVLCLIMYIALIALAVILEMPCFNCKEGCDVVGTTVMAAAVSCPQFFMNFIGTFITKGVIGVSTVVGSAVFNMLAVPAYCGLCVINYSLLHWWPITRDCLMYLLSILTLAYIFMHFNPQMCRLMKKCLRKTYSHYRPHCPEVKEFSAVLAGQQPAYCALNLDLNFIL